MSDETKQYIYVLGLTTEKPISLGGSATLEATECHPNEDTVKAMTLDKQQTLYDFGIAAASLWLVDAQIVVEDEDPTALAAKTWNSLTSLYFLGALVGASVRPCIQSNVPAQALSPAGRMHALSLPTGILPPKKVTIRANECSNLERQVAAGMNMLNDELFSRAAHALWSNKWIPNSASRMAILWGGIESLFGMQSELSFRLSYEIAMFLDLGIDGYKRIKKLYNQRSKAVHSRNQIKAEDLESSEALLRALVIRCIELQALPDEDLLLFRR